MKAGPLFTRFHHVLLVLVVQHLQTTYMIYDHIITNSPNPGQKSKLKDKPKLHLPVARAYSKDLTFSDPLPCKVLKF